MEIRQRPVYNYSRLAVYGERGKLFAPAEMAGERITMLNCLIDVVSGRALIGAATVVLVGSTASAIAQTDIALVDASFEDFVITDPGFEGEITEGILPFFPFGWQETGFASTEQGFTGLLDAGIFLNRSYNLNTPEAPFPSPTVPNADGNQLAYMRFSADANSTGPATTVSQQTSESFEAFTDYTFTIAMGQGQLQPPGSTDPVLNPYTAIISIGYYTDGATVGSGFNALASEIINVDHMVSDGSGTLTDFSVSLETDDALFVNPLVIHIEQSGGTTGGINLDHARLTKSAVPEPTSLALLGLGGLLFARRCRSRSRAAGLNC